MQFKPHSKKQQDAILSNAKITACITGIQWGKSTVGAVWLKRHLHTYADSRYNFLVAAPTYKILEQATIPAFLSVMSGCGNYNSQRAVYTTNWGTRVFFRTGTEPDSVVGITNVRAVWGDEAGKYTKYFWDNLQARAAFLNAPVMLTTSPYSLNWIYKELIQKRPDYALIIGAESRENPHFPQEVWERRRAELDSRRFAALYGGKFERMQGLVYPFDPVAHVIPESMVLLPEGTEYYAGVDWGFTNPMAIVVRAVTPDAMHYQVAEVYRTGVTSVERVKICQLLRRVYPIKTFFCDPADPAAIAALGEAKLPAAPANNNIRQGIDAHYELIATNRYKIIAGTSPNTIDEYEQYHYPEPAELTADQAEKEQLPVKQHDHAMDANRYVTMGTMRIGSQEYRSMWPYDRGEHRARIEQLKRKKKPWEYTDAI